MVTSRTIRKMLDSPPQFVIETDASLKGWGAYSCGMFTGGCWSPEEALLHINVLEMLAVLYGIKSFVKGEAKVKTILIKSDNITVVQDSIQNEYPLYCLSDAGCSKPIKVEVVVDGNLLTMELDTGAAVSLVSKSTYQEYWPSYLNHMGGTKSQTGVGMVPSKEHNPLSPVSTGVGEGQSRLSLPIPNRQNRLAPQPNNIPAINRLWGPREVDLFTTRLTAQFTSVL